MEREQYGAGIPNEREQRLIALVAQGLKIHEVAIAMGTSEHVVKNYLRAIYDKLGLWNRVELALWHEARQFEVEGSLSMPRRRGNNSHSRITADA